MGWSVFRAGSVARRLHRRVVFSGAMKELRRSVKAPGYVPSSALMQRLVYGWGNPSWSAHEDFLIAAAEAALVARGPILECGSGLSTLILGMVAPTGSTVWSLEHHLGWYERMRLELTRHALDNVELCYAKLHDRGSYCWYGAPKERMPGNFALVVCDGPPHSTPGHRYGLLPEMRSHLAAGCTILLDDAGPTYEGKTIERWASELGTGFTISGTQKRLGRLTVP